MNNKEDNVEADIRRKIYVLACKNFYRAAKYASRNNLWLHAWSWLETEEEEVVVYMNTKYIDSGNPLSDKN